MKVFRNVFLFTHTQRERETESKLVFYAQSTDTVISGRQRQRDRQAGRQTDRDIDRETDRQKETDKEREREVGNLRWVSTLDENKKGSE